MDEAEDVGRGAEFFEGFDYGAVGVEVLLDFARLNVEDVDEDCDVGKDGLALCSEVGLGEGGLSAGLLDVVHVEDTFGDEGLPATVPQV